MGERGGLTLGQQLDAGYWEKAGRANVWARIESCLILARCSGVTSVNVPPTERLPKHRLHSDPCKGLDERLNAHLRRIQRMQLLRGRRWSSA